MVHIHSRQQRLPAMSIPAAKHSTSALHQKERKVQTKETVTPLEHARVAANLRVMQAGHVSTSPLMSRAVIRPRTDAFSSPSKMRTEEQ